MATNHGAPDVSITAQCYFCNYFYKWGHDDHCPDLTPQGSPERRRWKEGQDLGYDDKDGTLCPSDPVARLGYERSRRLIVYSENVCRVDYYDD